MTAFFRFPHTPHIAWIAAGRPRDDKVLAPHEVREMLSGTVIVEEKVDGANLGLSVDAYGDLQAQNRGTYLDLDTLHGQWKPLERWLSTRRHAIAGVLGPDLILFGEWCYAVHSVRYARLPDWFLAFDVYDRAKAVFWTVERRNELARRLGLEVVPELGRGRFDIDGLTRQMANSLLTDGPAEGLYIRREDGDRLIARAKLVRAEFVQAINEHWSKKRLEENQLDKSPGAR